MIHAVQIWWKKKIFYKKNLWISFPLWELPFLSKVKIFHWLEKVTCNVGCPCSRCQRKIDSVVNTNEKRTTQIESRNGTTKFYANYTNCCNFTLPTHSISNLQLNSRHHSAQKITQFERLRDRGEMNDNGNGDENQRRTHLLFGSNLFSPFCFYFFQIICDCAQKKKIEI